MHENNSACMKTDGGGWPWLTNHEDTSCEQIHGQFCHRTQWRRAKTWRRQGASVKELWVDQQAEMQTVGKQTWSDQSLKQTAAYLWCLPCLELPDQVALLSNTSVRTWAGFYLRSWSAGGRRGHAWFVLQTRFLLKLRLHKKKMVKKKIHRYNTPVPIKSGKCSGTFRESRCWTALSTWSLGALAAFSWRTVSPWATMLENKSPAEVGVFAGAEDGAGVLVDAAG